MSVCVKGKTSLQLSMACGNVTDRKAIAGPTYLPERVCRREGQPAPAGSGRLSGRQCSPVQQRRWFLPLADEQFWPGKKAVKKTDMTVVAKRKLGASDVGSTGLAPSLCVVTGSCGCHLVMSACLDLKQSQGGGLKGRGYGRDMPKLAGQRAAQHTALTSQDDESAGR
jgi:hypothetical protein